jgi:hypothetical protein
MSKTDKELTIEVVQTFIESLHAKQGTSPLNGTQVMDLIKSIHSTIQNLPSSGNE